MNNKGFYISKLVLKGSNKPNAEIDFAPGCNVISGASNTGKTFILQCIDFILGRGNRPKNIDEAIGYTEVFLEARTYDGKVFTLMRDLGDISKVMKADCDLEAFWKIENTSTLDIFNAKNVWTKDISPISDYLLKICGFEDTKLIKTNSDNKKRVLSFRDISHLTIIDEVTIVKEKSPIFNTNQTTEAAEGAVFQLLITGEDSSDLIEITDVTKTRINLKAQLQLLEDMLADASERIAVAKKEEDLIDVSIEEDIAEINKQYLEVQKALEEKVILRQKLWHDLEIYKTKLTSLRELLIRFNILATQYEADLKRLDFIDEGEFLLSQLSSSECRCPICNTEIVSPDSISESFQYAIAAESEKIKLNLADLKITISANEEERKRLEALIAEEDQEYQRCEEQITQNLEPFKVSIQIKLQDLVKRQNKILNLNTLRAQIASYTEKRITLNAQLGQLKNTDGSKGEINKVELADFIKSVKSLLVEWGYITQNALVEFDTDWRVLDLIIDGKARSTNGKGVRGLLYSAFVLGILKHCNKENLPHTMTVILDTPVKSFREKDSGFDNAQIAEAVKNNFFETLSRIPKDTQVIVLENDEPPASIISDIKYHRFSGNKDMGRAAFIPLISE